MVNPFKSVGGGLNIIKVKMDDENESNLIYQLGVSQEECSLLSLKANSRFIKDLQAEESQAWIEFTSTTSARVTIGKEEYDLSFCDTKPTDAYIQEDWIQMARLGEVQGRLQVTSSRSAGLKESVVNATVEKLNLYPEPETKKREISLLSIGTGMSGLPTSSQHLTDSVKKAKISHPVANTTTTPKRKSTPYSSEPVLAPAQPTFDLSTSILLLGNIPVEVTANDILSTLFSGLSIAAIYICSHTGNSVISHTDSGCVVEASGTVDVYVEFSFIGGAELAMMRDGEELSYRSLTLNNTNNTTSTSTSSSTTTTPAKSAYTRKHIAPILQPVDQQLAFWVKAVGIKLNTTSGTGQTLTVNTPIKHYIEVVATVLHSTTHDTKHTTSTTQTNTTHTSTTHNSAVSEVLCDPVSLARQWQSVVSQLLLLEGCIDAFSEDNTLKVRILKDTEYIHRNPAVEDILLAHLNHYTSTVDTTDTNNVGFLCDSNSDGLYSVENDIQYTKYEHLVHKAEHHVYQYSTLWSTLHLRMKPTPNTKEVVVEEVQVKYVCELIFTRLSLYKALYKQVWSLSTTYAVFK